jgi:hypothetical protein
MRETYLLPVLPGQGAGRGTAKDSSSASKMAPGNDLLQNGRRNRKGPLVSICEAESPWPKHLSKTLLPITQHWELRFNMTFGGTQTLKL